MNTSNKFSAIITSGGISKRFGSNKLLAKISGEEVIIKAIKPFLNLVEEIVIPCNDDVKEVILNKIENKKIKFAPPGENRQKSVYNALLKLNPCNFVLIHDGARPFIEEEIIRNVIKEVEIKKAVVAGVKVTDTIKRCDNEGLILETPNRATLFSAQTPQAFEYKLILETHRRLMGEDFTDDAGMVENLGYKVYMVQGSYKNRKITNPDDLKI